MVMYRITYPKLRIVESADNSKWAKSSVEFPEAMEVVSLFKMHGNLGLLIDDKNPRFLKGCCVDERAFGKRISVLPDGRALNKAYSLFSKKLRIHDESSNSHWDVMFQNPNGNFSYVYTIDKERLFKSKKYQTVEKFAKRLPTLKKNLSKSLERDFIALPMVILLKTKMRVGSEVYYLKNHHKGLTTLKREDIRINGNMVVFDYIAKDGVPQRVIEKFSDRVVSKLRNLLKTKKNGDFVFVNRNGRLFKDVDFEKAFYEYCGERFYPHIVRSHYATEEIKKFLERHNSITKEEKESLYLRISEKLGHKRFSKKKEEWIDSYRITVNYYIQPELVDRIEKIAL